LSAHTAMENHGSAGGAGEGTRALEESPAFSLGTPQAAFSGDFSRFVACLSFNESLTFFAPALPGRGSEPVSSADELRISGHQAPAQKLAGRKERIVNFLVISRCCLAGRINLHNYCSI